MYRNEEKGPRHCSAAARGSAPRCCLVLLRRHIHRGLRMPVGVCMGDVASRDRAMRLRLRGARLSACLRHGSPPFPDVRAGTRPYAPALCCTMLLQSVLRGPERNGNENMWITSKKATKTPYGSVTARFEAFDTEPSKIPPTIHNPIRLTPTACRATHEAHP